MNDAKLFSKFLAAVYQKVYEKDSDITSEFINKSLFDDQLQITDIDAMIKTCVAITNDGIRENVDMETQLPKTSLTAEQQAAFAKFWKNYKDKILDQVKKDLVWNNRLEKFAWRVDLKTKTRKIADEINEPCAIIELNIVNGAQSEKDGKTVVRFEMNRDQVAETAKKLAEIHAILSSTK